ncbi:hypothetical protein [Streptomyces caniferus]|uniref:hypothetical protein n=1 Tax=Streptomyces caniferus TaxID=285557 RepID=UPI0037FEACF5
MLRSPGCLSPAVLVVALFSASLYWLATSGDRARSSALANAANNAGRVARELEKVAGDGSLSGDEVKKILLSGPSPGRLIRTTIRNSEAATVRALISGTGTSFGIPYSSQVRESQCYVFRVTGGRTAVHEESDSRCGYVTDQHQVTKDIDSTASALAQEVVSAVKQAPGAEAERVGSSVDSVVRSYRGQLLAQPVHTAASATFVVRFHTVYATRGVDPDKCFSVSFTGLGTTALRAKTAPPSKEGPWRAVCS